MSAIVYNTRFDTNYHNAESEKVVAPAPETVVTEKKTVATKALSGSDMEKYFFMSVILIGLGLLVYKTIKE